MKNDPADLVVWSDETLLAINKPSGLPSLPDGYEPDQPHVKSVFEPDFGPLWIVHRLDKETSGLLLLARSAEAHRALNQQFAEHAVSKVYHAFVVGLPAWDERRVELPLLADGDRKHRTIVDHRAGKPAATQVRVLGRFKRYALLETRPETGRTHQIRAHLAAVGFPLVADSLYGTGKVIFLSEIKPDYKPERAKERPLLGRMGLHAFSLEIKHPTSGQPLTIEAPYPKDFRAAVAQLSKL